MATHSVPVSHRDHSQNDELSIQDAVMLLSREERFMATVQAMNTLLVEKGIYTTEEFDALFISWARAQQKRPKKERPGH